MEDAESRRPSEEDKASTGYESGCVLMPNTSVGCTNLRGPEGAAVATLGLLPRALVSVTAAAVVVSLFAGVGNDDADDVPPFTEEVRAVLALLPRTSGCISLNAMSCRAGVLFDAPIGNQTKTRPR